MSTAQPRDETAPAARGERPSIRPNQTDLTPRLDGFGFTIRPAGSAFYKVIIGTTPALVRQGSDVTGECVSSGLIPASEPVYPVLPSQLRSFKNRPGRLYFTVVGFADRQGNGAVPEFDASTPDDQIHYVCLSRDYWSKAMSSILCIPLERLQSVRYPEETAQAATWYENLTADALSAAEDRAEGEDGYGLSGSATAEECGAAGLGMDDGYDDGFGVAADTSEPLPPAEAGPEGESQGLSESYGYGRREGDEPVMLEDEENLAHAEAEEVDPKADGNTEYSDGFEFADGDGPSVDEPVAAGLSETDPEPTYEEPSGAVSPSGLLAEPGVVPLDARPLTVENKLTLIGTIAPFESGAQTYAAINPDGEFAGRFRNHPAAGRYHIGLSYGIIQFTQDSGSLGRLLMMMRERSPDRFREVFGAQCDALIEVTNAVGPLSKDSPNGRSARVRPVGGADLWQEPWVSRFRRAAAPDLFGTGRQLFNGAQNELAARSYLDPMLPFCAWLGLNTDRALAIAFDRAVQMGVGGARRWIIECIGPVTTPALRQQALAAIGHTNIESFQRATPGLTVDGDFGPVTHAAMVAALRRLGGRSPVPIPGRTQMLDTLVRRAESTRWSRRTRQLFESRAFADTEFDLST